MTFETFVGISASVLTAVCLIPQLVKLYKEKKGKEISFLMLIVLIVGELLWAWYGFLKEDPILIISNLFGVLVSIAILILTIKYRDR